MTSQKKGNLYLIPTPLAENTNDKMVTNDLKSKIKTIDHFIVENARTIRRFISSLSLNIEIERLNFRILDKKTKSKELDGICAPLVRGMDVGLLSEAGCPGIADPGNMAVTFAHKHGIKVIPLVGPSSIFMALMASGLNGQNFAFHGYLPIEKPKRISSIKSLEKELQKTNQTQIFMETPYRNMSVLSDMLHVCKSYTRLCIASNITGENEMIATKTVQEWRKTKIDLRKSPTIFLMG